MLSRASIENRATHPRVNGTDRFDPSQNRLFLWKVNMVEQLVHRRLFLRSFFG